MNKKTKYRQNKSSFTLLELLVAMSVFSVMMTVLMQYFASAQRLTTRSHDRVEVFEKARIALEMIARDLQSFDYDSSYRAVMYDEFESDGTTAIPGGDDNYTFQGGSQFYDFKTNSITFMSASQNIPEGAVETVGLVSYELNSSQLKLSVKAREDDTSTAGKLVVGFGDFTDIDGNGKGEISETIITDVAGLKFEYAVTDPSDPTKTLTPISISPVKDDPSQPIFPEIVTISLTLKKEVNGVDEERTFTKMAFIGNNRGN